MSRKAAICLVFLILTPLAAYWGTVFHDYGFRDDYAHLREVHEEPGKLLKFTTSNGRPVYGVLLENSVKLLRGVDDLPWLRLACVLFLASTGVALWALLRRRGWSEAEAAVIGVCVALLPAAQVLASWAIAWPLAFALLLAVAGFALVEVGLGRRGWQRVAAMLGGGLLYLTAGFIYQSNALFAVVPLAAVLLLRPGRGVAEHARWTTLHLGILCASLLLGFALVEITFDAGVVEQSERMHFETNILAKLSWFLRSPLANALGLFALRDRFNTGAVFFWGAALLSAVVISFGWRFAPKTPSHRARWLVCAALLPFVAHGVSLASSAWVNGYRTLFALAGLVVVLVVFGLRTLRTSGRIEPRAQSAALAVLAAVAAGSASYNSYALLAEPQSLEWTAMREAAERVPVDVNTSVYIITPLLSERSTVRLFSDEFGSLSSDSDWVPKEMFKTAMRERLPEGLPPECSFTLTAGHDVPDAAADFDAVIDLRRFKDESVERPGFVASTAPRAESCPLRRVANGAPVSATTHR
jgi:hypothetical protein